MPIYNEFTETYDFPVIDDFGMQSDNLDVRRTELYTKSLNEWFRKYNISDEIINEYKEFLKTGANNQRGAKNFWGKVKDKYQSVTNHLGATPKNLVNVIQNKWDGFTKKIEAVKDKAGNLKYQTLQPFRFAMVGYLNRKGVKTSYSDPIDKTANKFYMSLKAKAGIEGYTNPVDGSSNPVSPGQIQQIILEIMQFFSDIANKSKNGGSLSAEETQLKQDAEKGETMTETKAIGGDWSGTLKIVVGIAVLIAALKVFKVF